jgi:predicted Fe-Mo cluster-binding NifX family protein
MSCYFRHLKEIFDEAGILVTSGNRKQIDQAIHQVVGVTYKECPQAWKALKQQIMGDAQQRQDFIKKLQAAIS